MASNQLLTKFDTIVVHKISGQSLVHRILYSEDPKNEKLAIMNADFNEKESINVFDLLNTDVPYLGATGSTGYQLSPDQIETLSSIGVVQSDCEGMTGPIVSKDAFESYYNFPELRLTAIHLPDDCDYIDILDSSNPTRSVRKAFIPHQGVERYVALTQVKDLFINPSAQVHDNSKEPHSDLNEKVLMTDKYYGIVTSDEFPDYGGTGPLTHIKSGLNIADGSTGIPVGPSGPELSARYELRTPPSGISGISPYSLYPIIF